MSTDVRADAVVALAVEGQFDTPIEAEAERRADELLSPAMKAGIAALGPLFAGIGWMASIGVNSTPAGVAEDG